MLGTRPGAQTERRGGAGPVRLLLGGETHRPSRFSAVPGPQTVGRILKDSTPPAVGSLLAGLQLGQQLLEVRPGARRLQIGVLLHASDVCRVVEVTVLPRLPEQGEGSGDVFILHRGVWAAHANRIDAGRAVVVSHVWFGKEAGR